MPAPVLHKPSIEIPEPSGDALDFPSPYHLLLTIRPEVQPHPWQQEELLRLGGYIDPYNLNVRTPPSSNNPYIANVVAANGSGKDEFIIAAFNVWFAMCGKKNLSVNTSSSFDQLKYQTEVHICSLLKDIQKYFPGAFNSREFYHVCALTGSEIKLFATDEASRAEGYHPRTGGKMAIIVNEAKSVEDNIFEALSRCTGYSYWLNISSPGTKSGEFYRSWQRSTKYPAEFKLGSEYARRITAYDCPHLSLAHIEHVRKTKPKALFESSILALFTDVGTSLVIPPDVLERNRTEGSTTYTDNLYCLSGDLAAGGDENSLYLRYGGEIIDQLHFTQADTTLTPEIIHEKFKYILHRRYCAVMDDGGIGKAIIDRLVQLGWNITRRHNQAAAGDKRAYLNFGAESYFHLLFLLQNNLIKFKSTDPILIRQLTSRAYDQLQGGKFRLEPKPEHKARLHESPDRADAFVLCYSTLPIKLNRVKGEETKSTRLSLEEFSEAIAWGEIQQRHTHANTRRKSYVASI